MTINNDQKYITKTLAGETNAFSFLIEKYKVMVFSLAFKMLNNREEAEEVSQDTFIKAYKNLSKFKGESKFSTWLYKIAYRNCLDVVKKNEKRYLTATIDEVTENKVKSTDDILTKIDKEERSKLLKGCLQKLPEQERSLLWMFYFDELSLKEIEEVTTLSVANIKVTLHRGRKKLLAIINRSVTSELIDNYGRQ